MRTQLTHRCLVLQGHGVKRESWVKLGCQDWEFWDLVENTGDLDLMGLWGQLEKLVRRA